VNVKIFQFQINQVTHYNDLIHCEVFLMYSSFADLEEGSVQVYSTPARHFCCSVVAQALQSSSHGKRTLIVQFLKGGIGQGIDSPSRLGEYFAWVRPDLSRCIHNADFSDAECEEIRNLWTHVQNHIKEYDLLILEEVGLIVKWGIISESELLNFIQSKSATIDLILVGTDIPGAIRDWADQWTEVKPKELSAVAA
jgi:cob(I)alamin adenosyltransferase